MTETTLLTILLALIGALFGVLTALIGWLGNKSYLKLEEISGNLVLMANELHARINAIDRRVVRLETKSQSHGNSAQD